MNKKILRIISIFILGTSLCCGCGNKKVTAEKEVKTNQEEQANVEQEDKDQEEIRKQQEEAKRQEEARRAQEQQSRQQQNNTIVANSSKVYVAASGKGKCYHRDQNCSRMKGNVVEKSIDEATSQGFKACEKCAN